MAGDVKISYGSTGFEKVARELAGLEKAGGGAAEWFRPMQGSLKDAEAAGVSFVSKLSSGLQSVGSTASHVVGQLVKVSAGITAIAGVVAGVATVAFASWSKGVLTTTESFRMLEISLYGALKSWESVKTVSEFAKKYSSEFPAMYKDVMQTIQSMAYMPAMKPMIMAGDVKLMKEAMDIVQGLATMRPEQGVQGATFALREALSGNWRSLQMRFDIPVESIARSAGMTMEQMKSKPEAGFQALGAFTKEYVGVDTMSMMAKNLGTQVDNLKEKYNLWKESIGKAGIYDKVINYLLKMNDVFENLLKSETLGRITKQISSFMESIADKIAGIFTKGINWEGIANLQGALEAFRKVGQNAMEALKEAWEVAKGPVSEALKSVITFGAQVAIDASKDLFFPVGKSMASGIAAGLEQGMKEHPFLTMLFGFGAGALLTPGGPMAKFLGGVAGMEAVALPSQIKTTKSLWQKYDEFMRGIGDTIADSSLIIREFLGIEPTRTHVPKEYTGPRPWQKRVEERAEEWPSESRWLAMWPKRAKPLTVWEMGAEEKFAQYQAWSRMAGTLAQAPMEAPKTAQYLFAIGAIPLEEYQQKRKIEEFRTQQMGRLEEIAALPEAGPELKSRLYGEMFTVSMGRGEFGKAEGFMTKGLEEMVRAMKEQSGMDKEQLKAGQATAQNTGEILKEIRDGRTLYTNRSPEERAAITRVAQKVTLNLTGDDWTEDDLRAEVRRALRE